jgi:hypothetical protein
MSVPSKETPPNLPEPLKTERREKALAAARSLRPLRFQHVALLDERLPFAQGQAYLRRLRSKTPAGAYRWLTVVSPEGAEGVELLLEPNSFPPAQTYQKALFDAGIPATMFEVDGVRKEYERLKGLGVVETCGNLIQMAQMAQQ